MDVFEGGSGLVPARCRARSISVGTRVRLTHHRRPLKTLARSAAFRRGENTKKKPRTRALDAAATLAFLSDSGLRSRDGIYTKPRRVGARTLVEEVDAWHLPCDALDRGAVERRRRPRALGARSNASRPAFLAAVTPRTSSAVTTRRTSSSGEGAGAGAVGGAVSSAAFRGDEREERRRGREEQEER